MSRVILRQGHHQRAKKLCLAVNKRIRVALAEGTPRQPLRGKENGSQSNERVFAREFRDMNTKRLVKPQESRLLEDRSASRGRSHDRTCPAYGRQGRRC